MCSRYCIQWEVEGKTSRHSKASRRVGAKACSEFVCRKSAKTARHITNTSTPAAWLTLQEVRSGTFLIVDMFIASAWKQYMHLAVKYSVLRIGLPALIHGHCITQVRTIRTACAGGRAKTHVLTLHSTIRRA